MASNIQKLVKCMSRGMNLIFVSTVMTFVVCGDAMAILKDYPFWQTEGPNYESSVVACDGVIHGRLAKAEGYAEADITLPFPALNVEHNFYLSCDSSPEDKWQAYINTYYQVTPDRLLTEVLGNLAKARAITSCAQKLDPQKYTNAEPDPNYCTLAPAVPSDPHRCPGGIPIGIDLASCEERLNARPGSLTKFSCEKQVRLGIGYTPIDPQPLFGLKCAIEQNLASCTFKCKLTRASSDQLRLHVRAFARTAGIGCFIATPGCENTGE